MKQAFYLFLILCTFFSCKTHKIVTKSHEEKTRTEVVERVDTLHSVRVQRDTIRERDSIFVKEYTKGDTIFVYKYFERYKHLAAQKADTIYRVKLQRDTIRITEKANAQIVEKKKDWKDTALVFALSLLIGFVLAYIIDLIFDKK